MKGILALQRKGSFYLNFPNINTPLSVDVTGAGNLLFNPNSNTTGHLNFTGQDTIDLVGSLSLGGSFNVINQSYIRTLAPPGRGVLTDTLILDPGSTLESAGGFTVNKYFSWGPDGESLIGKDSFTIARNAIADFHSAQGFNQGTILNNGTINWTYGNISGIADSSQPGGTIINNGTINAMLPADGSNLLLTDQQINNNGTIMLSAAGGGMMQFNTRFNAARQFNNNAAGRVSLRSGIFQRNIQGLENGVDSIGSGAVYQANAGALVLTNPVYYNYGVLEGNNIKMAGTIQQTLNGNGSIDSLEINNSNNIGLGGDQYIKKNLRLTAGNILLNQYDLVVSDSTAPGQAVLQGGSATSFIVAAGSGYLLQEVSGNTSATVLYPIGLSNSYLPATISLAPGSPSYTLGARVNNNLYNNYDLSDNPIGSPIATDIVQRTWFLQPFRTGGAGAPDASISLQWNTADQGSGFDPTNNVQLGHYTGGAWDPGAVLTVAGSNPFSITRTHVGSFSPFGIFSGGAPLPVTLLQFTGQRVPEGIQLEWQTTSELNNDHFIVERSGSGGNFNQLGTVPGKGTSSLVNDYHWVDCLPLPGDYYYRLEQVDQDGHISYSHILQIDYAVNSNIITIYPNPASNLLNIALPAGLPPGDILLDIYDGSGRRVRSASYNGSRSTIQMDISGLRQGSYMLTVIQNKSRQSFLFMKGSK